MKSAAHYKQQQRDAGDHSWDNKRQQNQSLEGGLAGKCVAVERVSRRKSDEDGDDNRRQCDDGTVLNRAPHGGVGEEHAIPIEREVARRKTAHSIAIEGVNDQHGDREIKKGVGAARKAGEEDRFACEVHANPWRRSSRCVTDRIVTTINRMTTATAAPSGQL